MQVEISNLIAMLSKQVGLFRRLESTLLEWRAAYEAKDVDSIYANLHRQTSLCEKLRQCMAETECARQLALAAFASARHRNAESPFDLPSGPGLSLRLRHVLAELALARQDVCRLNAQQRAFVDGSLRTLRLMNNALANCYPTYACPDSAVPFAVPGAQR